MSSLTLDEQLEIINRRWHDKDFNRKLVVTDHGFGHSSIKLEAKDFKKILTIKRQQEARLLFKLFGIRL